MSEDVPADVRTVLTQLFAEGQQALEADDIDTCRQTIESAEDVATNKLPEGELRDRVLHGCERVRTLLDADGDADADAAGEFLAAMERQIPDPE